MSAVLHRVRLKADTTDVRVWCVVSGFSRTLFERLPLDTAQAMGYKPVACPIFVPAS